MRGWLRSQHFNPRSPHGERPADLCCGFIRQAISIHAPRTGSDKFRGIDDVMNALFQSTLPARGATRTGIAIMAATGFQSTLPARGATYLKQEGRAMYRQLFQSTLPARGATTHRRHKYMQGAQFQSTLPARGATHLSAAEKPPSADFNPRSPHGERPSESCIRRWEGDISIHAPRTGSDWVSPFESRRASNFNPRSPHGERPGGSNQARLIATISIHAPRTGSDASVSERQATAFDFNPRSPHGERPLGGVQYSRENVFQSTLPARGATNPKPPPP